ncbi:MAG TPA: DUF559 domain-containing protein [Spirochaetota bacterium]|nr:DUF559 domain-containing protein [Spirochaetota bacterium]
MLYNETKVNTPKYVIEFARQNRQNLTVSEQKIWSQLRNKQLNGYKFRCQHPISRYILDFYCHKAYLAIEIDGDIHKKRVDYDNYRDKFLESIGITTLRFSVEEVMSNNCTVINKILTSLLKKDE